MEVREDLSTEPTHKFSEKVFIHLPPSCHMNIPSKNKPQEIAEDQLDHIVGGNQDNQCTCQSCSPWGPYPRSAFKCTRFNNTGSENK